MSTIKLKYEPTGITSGSTVQFFVDTNRVFKVVDEQGIVFDSSQAGELMTADFTISGSGVTSGVTTDFQALINTPIQFTDLTDNSPTEWFWDFGDNTSSRLQNPLKTYSVLSTGYTVSLLVGKSGAGDYIEKTAYIEVVLPPAVNLFDIYSGGVAGYSLRKLEENEAVVARIRNGLDNTEADYSDVDILAGLTPIGANSGFVTKLYDQANVFGDVAQATQGSQPIIKNAGTPVMLNGFPAMDNTADAGFKTAGSVTLNGYSELWMFVVVNKPAGGIIDWIIAETTTNYNGNPGAFIFIFGDSNTLILNQKIVGPGVYYDAAFSVPETGQILITANIKASTAYPNGVRIWINGVQKTSLIDETGTSTIPFANGSFNIFSRDGSVAPYLNLIQEFVVFSGDQSGVRANIEQNIMDYYGIS